METKTSGVHSVPVGEEIRLNAKSHPIIDRGSMLVRIEFAPQEEICEKSVENVIGVDWNLVSCLLTSFGTRQRISIFVNTSLLPLPRTKIRKSVLQVDTSWLLFLHMSIGNIRFGFEWTPHCPSVHFLQYFVDIIHDVWMTSGPYRCTQEKSAHVVSIWASCRFPWQLTCNSLGDSIPTYTWVFCQHAPWQRYAEDWNNCRHCCN